MISFWVFVLGFYPSPGGLSRNNTIVTIVFMCLGCGQHAFLVDRVPQMHLDTFRRNLKRLRRMAGFTQERLAERAGVSCRYLQSIEAGAFGCSFAVLLRLRRALNVSWNSLLRGLK